METYFLELAEELGWLAAPLFALLMVLQAFSLPVPAVTLTAINVCLFGCFFGVLLSWSASVAGAAGAYLLARRLGREWVVAHLPSGAAEKMDRLLAREGRAFFVVFCLRALPFPFGLASYASGLAGIPFVPYMLGTALGKILPTLLYAGIGKALLRFFPSPLSFCAAFCGLCLLLCAVRYLLSRRGGASARDARKPD